MVYKFARDLGYKNPTSLDYYKKPDTGGSLGFFKEIFSTDNVFKICTQLDMNRVLYMEERHNNEMEDDDYHLGNIPKLDNHIVITISDDEVESEGEYEWKVSAKLEIGCP